MATAQQLKLLRYIHSTIEQSGICPSYQEMMEAMGFKSKSGVDRLVKALETMKMIKRQKEMKRSIEVLRFPGLKCPKCGHQL